MAKKRKGPYAHQPVPGSENKPAMTNNEGVSVSDKFIEDVSKDSRVQLLQADFAKQAAQQEAGVEEEVYGFWGVVWKIYMWYHNKTHGFRFKKKTYMWLLFLTGWCGGHRIYQGRWILGAISVLTCWTCFPLVLCVQDFMEVYPIKPDEDGYIVI